VGVSSSVDTFIKCICVSERLIETLLKCHCVYPEVSVFLCHLQPTLTRLPTVGWHWLALNGGVQVDHMPKEMSTALQTARAQPAHGRWSLVCF